MIKLRDASLLALTKLRTRKIRLSITVIVSGLLFMILVAASILVRGAFASVNRFSKEGFGNRYIVQGLPVNTENTDYGTEKSIISRAEQLRKDTIARKKAAAKKLGIDFDATTIQPLTDEFDGPNGKIKALDLSSDEANQAISEYIAAHPYPDEEDFTKLAKPYTSKPVYESNMLPYGGQDAPNLIVLKDGKEKYDLDNNSFEAPTGVDAFSQQWTTINANLLKPFRIPGSSLDVGTDGSIPVTVPMDAAEQLLKLKTLPATASAAQRLDRLKEVRSKIPSIRFSVCYRNNTSMESVQQAIEDQKQLAANKNKKDYQKPELIYDTPAKACGTVRIARDVRTNDAKNLAQKQLQFDEMFGKQAAKSKIINFRVVGVFPPLETQPAAGLSQLLSTLFTSSLGSGWFTPSEVVQSNQLITKFFKQSTSFYGFQNSFYAEFDSPEKAKAFIGEQSCDADSTGPNSDQMKECKKAGKLFALIPYGSSSLGLSDAKKTFNRLFYLAGLVLAAVAAITMVGTVGRVIADSRRETAVFRALGAKRTDIVQVYLSYTVMLSLLIALFALLAGVIAAIYMNHRLSPDITVSSLVAFSANDLTKKFTLYAFNLRDFLYLIGLVLLAGFISASIPIIANIRRNPINDMRDER